MKRFILFLSPVFILVAGAEVFGQHECDFNIVGAWKVVIAGASPTFVSFSEDGAVVVRSGLNSSAEQRELASGTYKLDYPKSPKAIQLTGIKAGSFLREGTTSMELSVSDDSSFTSNGSGTGSMRWVRVSPFRHFLVLAGREGNWRDGGPAFAMLIKKDGSQTLIETAGLYFANNTKRFGSIPEQTYSEFLKEPRSSSDVMLRLEITGAEFERALKITQDWQRRAREHTLPYPPAGPRNLNVDTSVLLKQIVEDLNRCTERISLYHLTWRSDDEVAVNYNPRQVPFQFLKRLRQLNEKRHVVDQEFARAGQPPNTAIQR